MSKYLFYTDIHFCEFSSLIRGQGDNYSVRLENLIKSVDWAEQLAIKEGCERIFCLGDFFDKPDLNARELTALKDIEWANIPHYFLVGNHEASVKSLKYNSVNALKSLGFHIISDVTELLDNKFVYLILPYITEDNRKTISEYKEQLNISQDKDNIIVFSHNDISGIRYGAFESKEGFAIDDIENNCRLFLNGHLHNGTKFCNNGVNLGNLTGQNFSEDALNHSHCAFILDTETLTINAVENPYAFNFYKLAIETEDDLKNISLKSNAVVSIKCDDKYRDTVAAWLENNGAQITERRLITIHTATDEDETTTEAIKATLTVDHLAKLVEFCKERIDNTEILNVELEEICK